MKFQDMKRINRRQFLQTGAAVVTLPPISLFSESTETPSPNASASLYPSGIRVAGIQMIPVVDGKYKVWTRRMGRGKTKVLLLHGGPAFTHNYLEAMESFLPDASIEMYSRTQQ